MTMSKRLGGGIDCKDKTSSWDLIGQCSPMNGGIKYCSSIGSTVY